MVKAGGFLAWMARLEWADLDGGAFVHAATVRRTTMSNIQAISTPRA
jgi:hypothetical protein